MSNALRKQATVRAISAVPRGKPKAASGMGSTLNVRRQVQQAEQHEILYKQFGGIASAPNGVERLRELILSLAVRGKLVPQDPNDEPASKLLEKLRAQKTKSIKEGMARKTRATEINTDEDIPYTLPPSWKWSQISEIGSVFNGNSISDDEKVSIYSKVTKGLPFVATKDVGYGRTSIVYDNGLRIPFDAPQFKIAHKGAVLICAEGGSAGKKLAITDKDICFGNKLFANEVHQGIVPKFVFYIYQSRIFRDLFRQKMTGIIGGISLNSFLRMPIPIPPYKEQERIASKIDELMEACDRLEAQQADAEAAHKILVKTLLVSLTQSQDAADFASNWRRISEHFDMLFNDEASIEELKQTALQLAVMGKLVSQNNNDEPIASLLAKLRKEKSVLFTTGKTKKSANYVEAVEGDLLFAIPITWKWIPLQNIIVFGPQNGISPRPSSRSDAPRAVTLSATTKGKFDPAFYKRVDAEIAKDSEFWLKKGDLLFQRGNAREYVGMAAYYDGKDGEFLYPDLMMKLRLSKEVSLRYVHICCVSLYARRYFSTHASGTSESMPKINQATLTELPIPLPPLAEQHRIVAKVDELMAICDTLKSRITESKTLHEQLADALVKQGAAA